MIIIGFVIIQLTISIISQYDNNRLVNNTANYLNHIPLLTSTVANNCLRTNLLSFPGMPSAPLSPRWDESVDRRCPPCRSCKSPPQGCNGAPRPPSANYAEHTVSLRNRGLRISPGRRNGDG